jgi:hypothetical protein
MYRDSTASLVRELEALRSENQRLREDVLTVDRVVGTRRGAKLAVVVAFVACSVTTTLVAVWASSVESEQALLRAELDSKNLALNRVADVQRRQEDAQRRQADALGACKVNLTRLCTSMAMA